MPSPDSPRAARRILSAIGPHLPILALWAALHSSRAQIWIAAISSVGYEILIFIVRFIRGVGQKSWAQIGPELEAVVVGWTTNALRDLGSGFRRRYKKRIFEEFNYFNVRGLTLLNAFTLELSQVFVDLRVSATSGKSALVPNLPPEAVDGAALWDFLRFAQRDDRSRRALAITGAPGSGKTTLLQHIALTFARNKQRAHRLRPMLPLLLFLREHAAEIVENEPTLGSLADSHFKRSYWTLQPPKGWFDRQLLRRRTIVLLDGLDEVADADARQAVSAWVDRQIANYPLARFVITARPQGYRAAPLRRADVLEVLPFRPAQVEHFVGQWYLANGVVAAGGARTPAILRRAANDADDLLKRLSANPSLESLTVNPLLLTMITMVHCFRGALPGSRVELYDEICEVLLGRWRQAKEIAEPLKSEQKRLVLQPLAALMMECRVREIRTPDALRAIGPVLDRLGHPASVDFLRYLQESSGVIQEKESDTWTFAHLTFQEFLAAAHWSRSGAPNDWSSFVLEPWWHETIRLYVAKGDATAVVNACVENGGVGAFVLAAECLDEAAQIDRETRARAMAWLDTTLDATDDERRVLAAEVRLRRRLKGFQRVSSASEAYIDTQHVTNAEYEYFVLRAAAKGETCQPQHWESSHAPDGRRREPVEGVRPSDIRAFLAFVRSMDVGISSYRLPSLSEVIAVPSASRDGGTVAFDGPKRVIGDLSDADRSRLVTELRGQHLSSEPQVLCPPLEMLIVDSGFMSLGTVSPYMVGADAALARAIDSELRDVVLRSCRTVLDRKERSGSALCKWAAETAIAIIRGRKRSLYVTSALNRQMDEIMTAISQGAYARASEAARRIDSEIRVEDRRMRSLLCDLMEIGARSMSNALLSAHRALARMALYTYVGYEMQFGPGRQLFVSELGGDAGQALILYWFTLMTTYRSSGSALPIDCIRMVRERIRG
jgi:hypothetical protein